jgi:hypothetical protein
VPAGLAQRLTTGGVAAEYAAFTQNVRAAGAGDRSRHRGQTVRIEETAS